MNLTAARLLPLVDTRRAPLRAALMSGLLLAAAFPPSPAFLLGLIALVPFYRVLLETRHGFRTGLVAGFGYNLGTVWWIGLNSDLPAAAALASMLAAVLWLSLLWGVSAALTVWFVRRHGALGLWAHPLAVIAVDWIVSGSEMGFPWNLIGVSQALNPMIRPVAALAGMLPARAPMDPDFHRYPTAATLVVDFQVKDWTDVRPGLGSVMDFFVPSGRD